jgi:hypothetical protein
MLKKAERDYQNSVVLRVQTFFAWLYNSIKEKEKIESHKIK